MALDFIGGISPEAKFQSKLGNVISYMTPSSIRLELDGRKMTVSEGENIAIGQPLTDGDSPLFSGISGTVMSDGDTFITVKNDFKSRVYSHLVRADKPLKDFSSDEITELMSLYGIREKSDGKLLSDKLRSCISPERIIINCTETDFCADAVSAYISEYPDALLGGVKILMKALEVSKAIFVCTENNTSLIENLKALFGEHKVYVIAELKQKYPLVPQTVFLALYNRQIPKGKTSDELGYLYISAETAIQTYISFSTGLPAVYKLMSLTGEMINTEYNITAPIGADIREIISASGATKSGKYRLTIGSIFADKQLKQGARVSYDTDQVIAQKPRLESNGRCIRCGECISACPMRLDVMSYALNRELKKKNPTYRHIDMCISCGCCRFVCPTGVPLTDIISNARKNEGCKEDKQ